MLPPAPVIRTTSFDDAALFVDEAREWPLLVVTGL